MSDNKFKKQHKHKPSILKNVFKRSRITTWSSNDISDEASNDAKELISLCDPNNPQPIIDYIIKHNGHCDAIVSAVLICIELNDSDKLKCLVDNGVELNYIGNYDEFTILDKILLQLGHLKRIDILSNCILPKMNTQLALKVLIRRIRDTDYDNNDLQILFSGIISTSRYPLITTLLIAENFKELAEKELLQAEGYIALYEYFTDVSINLIRAAPSDYIAAILVEQADSMNESPLSIALRSHNLRFIGCNQMQRILNTLWAQPNFMSDISSNMLQRPVSYSKIVSTFVYEPKNFFLLPLGQFCLEVIGFMIFVLLWSYIVQRRLTVFDGIQTSEIIMGAFVISFLIEEFKQIHDEGIAQYLKQGWNLLDILIYTAFVMIYILRLSVTRHHGDEVEAESMYHILVSVNAILLWVRISYILIIHPSVGPLLRMVSNMLTDVKNFAIFSCLFMCGFALSFRFLVGYGNYGSLSITVLTLFRAMVGDFSFDDFDEDEMGKTNFIFAQLLLCLYISLTNIMMLNMLIAMMADSYSSIQGDGILEALFGRASVAIRTNRDSNELPPPMNVFVYVVAFLISAGKSIWLLITCRASMIFKRYGAKKIERHYIDGKDPATWYLEHLSKSNTSPLLENEDNKGNEDEEKMNIVNEFPNFIIDEYICGYCHYSNEKCTNTEMRRRIEEWLILRNDEDIDVQTSSSLIDYSTILCQNCYRVKKSIDAAAKEREDLSFVIFIIIIWIPFTIAMSIPFILIASISALIHYLEERNPNIIPKNKQKIDSSYDPVENQAWVSNSLAEHRKTIIEENE